MWMPSARRALKEAKIPGFESFRRFRRVRLRERQVPEELIAFWLGYSAHHTTKRYSVLSQRLDIRRDLVERVGLGFVPRC